MPSSKAYVQLRIKNPDREKTHEPLYRMISDVQQWIQWFARRNSFCLSFLGDTTDDFTQDVIEKLFLRKFEKEQIGDESNASDYRRRLKRFIEHCCKRILLDKLDKVRRGTQFVFDFSLDSPAYGSENGVPEQQKRYSDLIGEMDSDLFSVFSDLIENLPFNAIANCPFTKKTLFALAIDHVESEKDDRISDAVSLDPFLKEIRYFIKNLFRVAQQPLDIS